MTIPFTYRITCIPTKQHYYGVRYQEGCSPSDLWVTYFTSSKLVHSLIEEHGPEQFRTEIRRIFNNKDAACMWEYKVLCKLQAHNNPLWLNLGITKTKANRTGHALTLGKSNKGRSHINTGHQHTRPRYQASIKWMYHPITLEEKQAAPNWINYYKSKGFVFGRSPNMFTDKWKAVRSKQYTGNKNPGFGKPRPDLVERNKIKRTWLTNGTHTTKVTQDKVEPLMSQGYWIGRN